MTKDNVKAKQLQEELESLTDRLKRAMADYQNLEKRVAAEKAGFIQFANADLVLQILPALDNLERAEKHLNDEGLNLALKQLRDSLEAKGLKKIETGGLKFDPEVMECVEVAKGEDNKVLDEFRPGYKLNGRLLRLAQVKVGRTEGGNDK